MGGTNYSIGIGIPIYDVKGEITGFTIKKRVTKRTEDPQKTIK
jgi:hypothetical protein